MLARVEAMNSLGVRLTGSKAHNDFIESLKNEIHGMGIETYSDPYYFDRWEEKESSLTLENGENIHISSAFPYSGETPDEGIESELVYVNEKHVGFLPAAEKIAVVNVDELDFLPSTLAFHKRRSQPENLDIPEKYDGPVATAFVNFPFLKHAKEANCKAVICIWRKMSDGRVEGQYLPFILDYQGIPAVWLNSADGDRVLEAAKTHSKATLKLIAEKEECARTETFYSILPGKNRKEAIIINTHTDGVNCVEENGAIAMLSMMKHFKDIPLERSLIFVFITGHFRLPNFKTAAGGGVQATSKWLAAHPDLWDGKKGHVKAVACVSVEHLGCEMYKDVDGSFVKVGDVDPELVYTGNQKLDDIYYEALEGREKVNTITLRGHNFLHFGEGQPPFNVGIPEISLVTAPDYLTAISDDHEMDKFSIDLMYEQTDTFIKIVDRLLPLTADEIGRCDGYSLVFPNGEPLIMRAVKKIIKK